MEKLPKILWDYFLLSTGNHLSIEYNVDLPIDSQVWSVIPSDQREWISFDDFKNSVFLLKKELIGLDFNESTPIIADGKYWLNAIKHSIENDLSLESRNIYLFNHKMNVFVFYIENAGILISGSQRHLFKKRALLRFVESKVTKNRT